MRQVNPDGSQLLLLNGGRYHVEIAADSTESTARYYSIAGQRPAMRNNDGSINYLLGDHLGSVSTVVNASGEIISQSRYLPFGELLWEDGTSPTDYTYTGQRSLSDIGLMDYNARFYDPMLGRFTSPDSIVPDPGSVIGYNRFAYVNNNPMIYTDPSGHRIADDPGYVAPDKHKILEKTQNEIANDTVNTISGIPTFQGFISQANLYKNIYNTCSSFSEGERNASQLYLEVTGINNFLDSTGNWIRQMNSDYSTMIDKNSSGIDRGLSFKRISLFIIQTSTYIFLGRLATASPTKTPTSTAYSNYNEYGPASSYANKILLQKELARQEQLGQVGYSMAGEGSISGKAIRDIARLVNVYGGYESEWAKMSSKAYTAWDGTNSQTHWYRNKNLGLNVDYKIKEQIIKKIAGTSIFK